MANKNPKGLSNKDFAVYMAEAARIMADGGGVEQLVIEFDWDKSDVLALMNHPKFEAYLGEAHPDLLEVFQQTHKLSLNLHNARHFAAERIDEYIEQMDSLARNANNESVRYNATIYMMKLAGAEHEAEAVEIVELPQKHVKVYESALRAVLSDYAQRDSDSRGDGFDRSSRTDEESK